MLPWEELEIITDHLGELMLVVSRYNWHRSTSSFKCLGMALFVLQLTLLLKDIHSVGYPKIDTSL
jgi:hypothetical protein